MSNRAAAIPWPIATIDFEASALDEASYPIEVGVCVWSSPDAAPTAWSTLIRPTRAWRDDGIWWASSERIHGVTQAELENGMDPAAAMAALNALLGCGTAICDGGRYDVDWANKLIRAAGVSATWMIGDFDRLTMLLPDEGYVRILSYLEGSAVPHRARADAERLMAAFAEGLGICLPPSEESILPTGNTR